MLRTTRHGTTARTRAQQLTVTLLAALCVSLVACGDDSEGELLTILHTDDLHDHLMGFAPVADYSPTTPRDDATVGGFARLAAMIQSEREDGEDPNVLLLDAGDFMMGTAFSMLSLQSAPQLMLMKEMGYDAITLGNHEFDWGPAGLAAVIATAKEAGLDVPLLSANMQLSEESPDDDALAALVDDGTISPYVIKELASGKRVGIFGVLGVEGYKVAPNTAPIAFDQTAEAHHQSVQAIVNELRNVQGVDTVICLTHAGLHSPTEGETQELAGAVTGIDIVVGGHTHVPVNDAVEIEDTIIVQAGAYGAAVGKLEVTLGNKGRAKLKSFTLIPVDDSTAGDATTQSTIDDHIGDLNTVLSSFTVAPDVATTLAYDAVIAETGFTLDRAYLQESTIGNLVADAYRHVATRLQPGDPPVVAIEANGVIRGPLEKGITGQLWFADVFRVLPLGGGYDNIIGYPLVTYHMTSEDLWDGMEVVAAVANSQDPAKSQYFLHLSGMTMEYQDGGDQLVSVGSVALESDSTALGRYDAETCHKVVTNLYVAKLLGAVETLTQNFLSVEPLESDCKTVITDWSAHRVDADPATEGVQEVKGWQALIQYLGQFDDTDSDSIADMPTDYAQAQGRIVAKP